MEPRSDPTTFLGLFSAIDQLIFEYILTRAVKQHEIPWWI